MKATLDVFTSNMSVVASGGQAGLEMLQTCAVFMTMVLTVMPSSSSSSSSALTINRSKKVPSIASLFYEAGFLPGFIDCCEKVFTKINYDDKTSFDLQLSALTTVLDFLAAVSDTAKEDADMKRSVVENERLLSRFIVENAFLHEYQSQCSTMIRTGRLVAYRGYVSRRQAERGDDRFAVSPPQQQQQPQNDKEVLSGASDPLHSVWVKAVRTTTSLVGVVSGRNKASVLTDFSRAFTPLLESCVQQVVSAFDVASAIEKSPSFQRDIGGPILTQNLLLEATEVLSFLEAAHPHSFLAQNDPHHLLASLLRGACTMLGDIGLAREAFSLVAPSGSVAGNDNDDEEMTEEERHPLLSNGTANARYEAMKRANVARRSYSPVSTDEYEISTRSLLESDSGSGGDDGSNKKDGNTPDQNEFSMKTLELRCRQSLASEFAKTIELLVARVAGSGLRILWKSHDSSSAFVKVASGSTIVPSGVQAGRVVAIDTNIAKNETKSPTTDGQTTTNTPSNDTDKKDPIVFMEVERIDTFRLTVTGKRCTPIEVTEIGPYRHHQQQQQQSETFPIKALVGMEKPTPIPPLLQHNTLRHDAVGVSMGLTTSHVVSLLWWCSNTLEHHHNNNSTTSNKVAVEATAGLATLVLVTDASVLRRHGDVVVSGSDNSHQRELEWLYGPRGNVGTIVGKQLTDKMAEVVFG